MTNTRLGPGGYPIAALVAGSGDQSLVPSLVASDDAFHAPTAAPGEVTLAASLHDDSDVFHVPTVDAITNLTASLHDDSDVFHVPTATVGDASLTASLVDSDDAFHAPAVTLGDASLTPGLVASDDAFYAPAVQPGEVALDASLVADADTFFAPTVLAVSPLVASLYSDTDAFFVPTVNQRVFASLVTDTDVIPATSVIVNLTLAPSFVDEDVVIHTPTDASFYYVFSEHIDDPESFFGPTITTSGAGLAPSLHDDTDVFYVPAVQRRRTQGGGGGGNPGTVTTDLKYATTVTMDDSGLIIALQMVTSSTKTVNTRMMVYADSAGLPGALLGQTNARTSVTAGTNEYTMVVPVSVLIGEVVWIALHTDGNVNWLLTNVPGGSRYNTDLFSDGPADPFGVSSLDNRKAPVVIVLLESANAAVLPLLHASDDTFFAPSLSKTYSITTPFLTDENFFYPTVTTGITYLLPDETHASDDAFSAPTVAPGAASVQPSLVDSDDSFASPFIGTGDGDVFSAEVAHDDVFYESTVTPLGGVALPVHVDDGDVFYAAMATPQYPLVPALEVSDDAFYDATVSTGSLTLQPSHVTDVDEHWISVLVRGVGDSPLLPEMIQDGDMFYAPTAGAPRRRRRVPLSGSVARPDILARKDNDRALEGDVSHGEIELEGTDA